MGPVPLGISENQLSLGCFRFQISTDLPNNFRWLSGSIWILRREISANLGKFDFGNFPQKYGYQKKNENPRIFESTEIWGKFVAQTLYFGKKIQFWKFEIQNSNTSSTPVMKILFFRWHVSDSCTVNPFVLHLIVVIF